VEIFESNKLWGKPTNIDIDDKISIINLVNEIAELKSLKITINTD
jgi:hypothetical protein